MINQDNIFSIPDFRKLYVARFISTAGSKFFALAISWWVLDSGLANASSILGIIMAATAIGTFGFAPFMGTFADKYSKKKTMMAALIGEAAIVGVVILIFPVFSHVPLLFALFAVMIYAFEPLFETSMQGSLNAVVKPSLVPAAVSVISGITSFSQALGAAFAGVAITVLGVLGAFSLDCACYLVSALFIARLVTVIPGKPDQGAPEASYWKDFAEGFRYVYKEKALLWLLVFFAFVNLWVSPVVLALPIIAKTVFDGTALLMSGYEVSMAIGIVAVTTVLGRITRRFNRYVSGFWAILLCGLSLCGLSFCSHEYLTFGFVFLFGMGLGLVNVSMITLFQMYVPTYIQGRFFSIVNTVAGAVIPLSYAFVGFFCDRMGVMPLITINGCVLAVSSVVMLFIPKIKGEYVL